MACGLTKNTTLYDVSSLYPLSSIVLYYGTKCTRIPSGSIIIQPNIQLLVKFDPFNPQYELQLTLIEYF